MNRFFRLTIAFSLLMLVFSVSAQTKKNKRADSTPKQAEQTEPQKSVEPNVETTPPPAGKKNSRPTDEKSSGTETSENQKSVSAKTPAFSYEFSQPQFVISHIRIEHDAQGKGKITFKKMHLDEEFSDPIQLAQTTLEKIQGHFEALKFLDSTENYQYEKDFSHLGTMKISMQKEGRARTAEFNWTANPDAKAIADEYRKISNQYIWMFDISVARQNQPLETPRIMKALDSYLKRNEISDPTQMIPFLKDLSDDERIPLIARNNAAKLIKDIEKKKKN
jgi:hypothetical protein